MGGNVEEFYANLKKLEMEAQEASGKSLIQQLQESIDQAKKNPPNQWKAVQNPYGGFGDSILDKFKEDDAKEDEKFLQVIMGPQPLSLANKASSPYHRILVIGDSGTGKTHFLGTMPKPFVADFDHGLATLYGKDVKFMQFTDKNWLEFKSVIKEWKTGPQWECETFCIDSLTMASEAALTWVMTKNGRSGQQPTVQDWGEAIREVKDVLNHVTTLGCNVCVVAHSQLVKDEVLGDLQYLPLIYGKDLPHRLGIYFDEVYMTTVVPSIKGGAKVNEYKLQVKPDSRMKILKSRMNTDGKIFELYEEPNFVSLVAKIQNPQPVSVAEPVNQSPFIKK